MEKIKNYIALFERNRKGGYSVIFPDFPGCITVGNNYDEALRMAHEALSFHVDGMKKDGEKIPEPRTLEKIQKEWEDWKDWEDNYNFIIGTVTLLNAPETTVKLTITLPQDLLSRIDAITNKRSTFLTEAARNYLGSGKRYSNQKNS